MKRTCLYHSRGTSSRFQLHSENTSNMDQISGQFDELKAAIPPRIEQLNAHLSSLKQQIPQEFEAYLQHFKNIDKDSLIQDFSELKATPVTITISVVSITTLLILGRVLFFSSSKKEPVAKKTKKKKKNTKAQKANKQVQAILDNFEAKWVPEINEYFANYQSLSKEDVKYKYVYFQEMLLKELFELDNIDTLGNAVIRENRKKVIQFIQDHQKRLDAFKDEIDL